ncbi:hypothetical protein [Facklamia lactis]|uniref:hypothetical protein n=1 Tax=Facklamia lactis TaxID=2749967 RepID=UPI0018CDF3F7|nr:hypothetical protein [Facklamia lactis]MBG9979488.1 hypothetical protein [Facklamia lactis]
MNSDELVQKVMERLLKQFEKESLNKYLVVGEELLDYGNAKITNDTNDYSSVTGVIANGFAWESLFRLRNLVTISEEEKLVLKGLLDNKSIIIIQPEKQPANKLIQVKVEETLRELKKIGVILLHAVELKDHLNTINQSKERESMTKSTSTKKKLITVDVLRNEYSLDQLTEFKQESNMIITALAKDYLRDNNIRMV